MVRRENELNVVKQRSKYRIQAIQGEITSFHIIDAMFTLPDPPLSSSPFTQLGESDQAAGRGQFFAIRRSVTPKDNRSAAAANATRTPGSFSFLHSARRE